MKQDGLVAVISSDLSNQSTGYSISYIFSSKGYVAHDSLEKTYMELMGKEPLMVDEGRVGTFDSIEQVQKFGFFFCQEFNSSFINFLSNDDYNEIVEKSFNSTEFIENMFNAGTRLDNLDKSSAGFLGKLFS